MRLRSVLLIAASLVAVTACAPAQVVTRGPADRREITLTFDVAFEPRYTPAFLDVLGRYGVQATMFVTGEWAEANPDLVQRMAAEGHLVANHTYSHPDLRTVSDDVVLNELARAEAAISALTNRTTKPYVRPPYGAQDARVNQLFGNAGFRYDVMWTVDSFGWNGLTWPEVVKRCLDRSAPGTIYMFHLGAQADLDALPWIIQWHRDQDYTIVRLDAWYPVTAAGD